MLYPFVMASCNGGWVGDGSGTWSGTFDDSNLVTLQRETAGVCNDITINVSDIKQQVFGAYGLQASWNLLHGAQISWQAFLGANAEGYTYNWYETARQIDGTNELVAANRVDLGQIQVKLRTLELKVEQNYVAIGNVANLVNSCLTVIDGVRNTLTAFRDECYSRLYRSVTAVTALLEGFLMPIYRVCKADGSAAGDIGEVTITPDIQVTNRLGSHATDAVVTTASSDGITVDVHRLEDYGLFYPVIGQTPMYYSDELRQVIARPYRNDGKVYLS